MFWLKACPHCGGNLREKRDASARYVSCAECGRILTRKQEKALPQATLRLLPHQLSGVTRSPIAA